jgi:hypothetical protein
MEIWKHIEGFEERYMISSYGRVKRVKRMTKGGFIESNEILQTTPNSRGYKVMQIRILGTDNCKSFTVHRLVATMFIPNPLNLSQINHKDGNKLNNKIENLEWCTPSQNMIHAVKAGLHSIDKSRVRKCGRIKGGVKVTKDDKLRIRDLVVRQGMTLKRVASMYNISQGYVCTIARSTFAL